MSAVPRGYSPELLRQYAVEQSVPDFAAYLAEYDRESSATRARGACVLDITYGTHEREKLDVFWALKDGAPTLISIHGGGWRGGSRSGRSFAADNLVPAGAAYVALGYPLLPEVSLDECVPSVREGVLWVVRNIPEFGGDPDNIHLCGNSAGAHLAAMAMLSQAWSDAGLSRSPVRSGCLVSGVFDMEPCRQGNANS
jgi:arylformamidase